MRKCFSIFFLSLVIIIGCSKQNDDDLSELNVENYSVVIVRESNADSLLKSVHQINTLFKIKSFLTPKQDSLFIGDFKSEMNAWYYAELFINDSLIKNYQIAYNRKVIKSDVNKMIFVSGYLNRPSLFEFDFNDKKTKMMWSQWGRKIIRLYPSQTMEKFFFTTGLTMGRSGGFPFITEARLYQYNKKENDVSRINIFGEGTQYTARWETPEIFKTSFIIVDSIKTSTIVDQEIFFDIDGNALDTNETVYNLLKDGFPQEKQDTLQVTSPSKEYYVQARPEAGQYIVSVFKDMSEFIGVIDTTGEAIQKIVWSKDENYVSICEGKYKKNSLEGEFNIYVYSLLEKKLITRLKNKLLRDVVYYGPYLLMDELNHDKQVIKIYDCFKGEMLTTISLSMDSGIYSIPIKMSRVKSENLF